VDIDSLTFSFIVNPVSFIYITVRMNQPTLSIRHITHPTSFINRTIRPDQLSSSISFPLKPLSMINRAKLQLKRIEKGVFWVIWYSMFFIIKFAYPF
jgi:hypothetical protein